MKRIVPGLITLLFFIVGCQEKKNVTPAELYEKFRPSVVLIKNEYLFKAKLDNDLEFFFIIDEEGVHLFDDEADAFQNPAVSFGTGFFLNKDGQIATNRHVVYPEFNDALVWNEISGFLDRLERKIQLDLKENTGELEKISELYNKYYNDLSYSQIENLREKYKNLEFQKTELENLLELTFFNPQKSRIELVPIDLGIAYDNTFVESNEDFKGCVRIRKSENSEIDLAIIQLKDKRTPEYITNFFELKKPQDIPGLKLNDEVFMIGYNEGIGLANTEEGIKSQFTIGNISQDPSPKRIMYTVPTLPGSSGSPVMDKWGNLVAINYAKTFEYQGFSFGVPAANLIALKNRENSDVAEEIEIPVIEKIEEIETDLPEIEEASVEERTIQYRVAPSASYLNWQGSKPTGEHQGSISIQEGSLTLRNEIIESGEVTFNMKSLKVTDDGMGEDFRKQLESHLKGTVEGKETDFFNVNSYPSAKFSVRQMNQINGKNYLEGYLTIKGIKRLIEFPILIKTSPDNRHLEIESEVIELDRTDWNVHYGSKSIFSNLGEHFIDDTIKVHFKLVARADNFL